MGNEYAASFGNRILHSAMQCMCSLLPGVGLTKENNGWSVRDCRIHSLSILADAAWSCPRDVSYPGSKWPIYCLVMDKGFYLFKTTDFTKMSLHHYCSFWLSLWDPRWVLLSLWFATDPSLSSGIWVKAKLRLNRWKYIHIDSGRQIPGFPVFVHVKVKHNETLHFLLILRWKR